MDLKEIVIETIEEVEDNIKPPKESKECNEEFLRQIRERILVLFDGLQSPNTQNLDVKLDVTINFLEYLLARIEEKLSKN
ncbi:MAG: hypothetical protein GXO62_07725 [Epsilonproteobacteria bacterium]|nr:hypothetical protein [Campylobacterota bacterium]